MSPVNGVHLQEALRQQQRLRGAPDLDLCPEECWRDASFCGDASLQQNSAFQGGLYISKLADVPTPDVLLRLARGDYVATVLPFP